MIAYSFPKYNIIAKKQLKKFFKKILKNFIFCKDCVKLALVYFSHSQGNNPKLNQLQKGYTTMKNLINCNIKSKAIVRISLKNDFRSERQTDGKDKKD